MEIIKDFGIDPVLLGAQIINFIVILLILKKVLYKPILNLLQKRKNDIKEAIARNEEAQEKLEKVIVEEKNILKNAQTNAKKTIDDAVNQAVETSKEIQENAKKQADKIIKEAQLQIEKEARETEKRLTKNISYVAVRFLEKSLKQMFSEKDQEEVIKRALKKIQI